MGIQALNNKIQQLLSNNVYSFELIEKIETEINGFNRTESLIIVDLVRFNLNNEDVKSLNSIFEFLFSTYNYEGKIEQEISLVLIEGLNKLTQLYYKSNNPRIKTSYYLIFDIFFHNPGLIEELDLVMKSSLINEIKKISKLKYSVEESEGSDLLMALQKIIDISFYFGDQLGKEILLINFLNHFDSFIVNCAKDELQANLPNEF